MLVAETLTEKILDAPGPRAVWTTATRLGFQLWAWALPQLLATLFFHHETEVPNGSAPSAHASMVMNKAVLAEASGSLDVTRAPQLWLQVELRWWWCFSVCSVTKQNLIPHADPSLSITEKPGYWGWRWLEHGGVTEEIKPPGPDLALCCRFLCCRLCFLDVWKV